MGTSPKDFEDLKRNLSSDKHLTPKVEDPKKKRAPRKNPCTYCGHQLKGHIESVTHKGKFCGAPCVAEYEKKIRREVEKKYNIKTDDSQ